MEDKFEKIEYLRENSDVGYEEASTLLDRYDGDMTRVMVELERANRLRGPKENPWDNLFTRGRDDERGEHRDSDDWFHKALHAKIRVNRNGEKLVDVPVVAAGALAVLAPYAAVAGAVGGWLTGCSVSYHTKGDNRTDETKQ
ncbi:MAG: DUF4342 domain-containing protein [Oscillospiraceae bacterium]|jgi:hypothetical protein|nr:DUF4342 domain-containing protein [Oscillospiraceae bacterium]